MAGKAVTETRPLTVKQQKFANHVAAGTPKSQAAIEAGYSRDPGYERAAGRRAAELAQKPHVAAEIRRQVWLSCPPLDEVGLAGMRAQAIRVIADLSRSAKSEAIRLKAGLALFRIAETMRAASNPKATDAEQDRLLSALRGLYHQIENTAAGADLNVDEPLAPVVVNEDEPIDITALVDPDPDPAT